MSIQSIENILSQDEEIKFLLIKPGGGTLKVGNSNFSVLIPTGSELGPTECYITSKKVGLLYGFQLFTIISGVINIYENYDDIVYTSAEGEYEVFYGNGKIILNRVK